MSSNERSGRTPNRRTRYDVAVLVPCYNEERAIAKVVADFRAALPDAAIYVYDNNSTDGTVEAARTAGAVVRRETHQGKGHVVRRMFNDIEADIYVLVDGDATYDAPSAPAMIDKLDRRPARHGGGDARRSRSRRLSARPSRRQLAADRLRRPHVRPRLHRYPVRLSRVLAALREIVSDSVRRLRDRDRADRPCARAGIAGRRGRDAVLFAAGGSASKLQHLARRLPHSVDRAQALPRRAAAVAVRRFRHRACHHVGRPRHPDLHHLRAGRPGAAPADRGALDRADGARLPVDCLRLDPRHRHARPARAEAASPIWRCARRAKSGAGAESCANSSAPTMPC